MGMATISDENNGIEITTTSIDLPAPRFIYLDSYKHLDETPVSCEPKVRRKPERKRTCKADRGERTNHKLKDQPYYHRGRKGKPKGY